MAHGMEAQHLFGPSGMLDIEALGADGNTAIGADFDGGANAPNTRPTSTSEGWAQDGSLFFVGAVPGLLWSHAQFAMGFVKVAMESQSVDVWVFPSSNPYARRRADSSPAIGGVGIIEENADFEVACRLFAGRPNDHRVSLWIRRLWCQCSGMPERISIKPDVCNGRPVVRGTRITVQTVLEFLAAGDSVEDVVEEYPKLTRADVPACLDYASRDPGRSAR